MKHWSYDSVFYHIYPIGFCGAPWNNDFSSPNNRLDKIYGWIGHLKEIGINAIYLGPLFESSTHGYDTADYYNLDRRLGNNETLSRLIETLHREGIKVIFDGVFHHVGRDFWAFKDVMANRENSQYCHWFKGLSFHQRSPYNDPFSYDAWNGHYNLVKLNLEQYDVKQHIFGAVRTWMNEFHIDGLRLDVADAIDMNFLRELSDFCHGIREDFWLMGEVIHGDYRMWRDNGHLNSVTNYEVYKGLYSSHNDKNYFEIAFALNRQFGEYGLYKDMPLYNFADNHDVNRVSTSLGNSSHLYPLYCILFTMPGIPSIYYGSEWGIEGRKNGDDTSIRPCITLDEMNGKGSHLPGTIKRLSHIRRNSPALCHGNYEQLFLTHEQLAFSRRTDGQTVIVAVNASDKTVSMEFDIKADGSRLVDWLNEGECSQVNYRKVKFDIYPYWARIMVLE